MGEKRERKLGARSGRRGKRVREMSRGGGTCAVWGGRRERRAICRKRG